ncbi:TetR family transcriptional regulator [Roseimicrobium gellanilyticum]|uniref:TetR family transcriptional regulator n=1 Tax=Roseimicrobium gellanilyticum TaxID=748857 RepID=A0A366HLN0_9BACT|nr:TetR/AcrR family transcriptional regulator [Roseimicrobium gellanilyticum]RBP43833.1 TetR family transcriptional regulator [Roseimicrobium gellanilyticum]
MSEAPSKVSLLSAAKSLFLARGYAGTSVDTICEKAGVSKGSFYHSFKSKEDLGIGVLQWSLERGGEVLGAHKKVADPVEQSLVYLRHLENSALTLWSDGCLLGTFANELGDTNPRLQEAVATLFTAVIKEIAARLKALAACPEITCTANELAEELLVILEGSITLAKAYRDPSRITRGIRSFRKTLESQISKAAAKAA